MSLSRIKLILVLANVLGAVTSFGGPEPTPASRETYLEAATFEAPAASFSHGLITTEGPSGMFINPTSGTLPQGTFVLNYCVFVPTIPEGVGAVWHGVLLSYGVRDWLEVGFIANLEDLSLDGPPAREDSFVFVGPMARIRLLRDREWWPELSVGAYLRLGTPANVSSGYDAFLAASKTIPIAKEGFFRSVTLQGGFREQWLDDAAPVSNINRLYGGVEVQLPAHLYVIGEITQRDNRIESRIPWAAGVQWRGKWFGCTIAAVQLDGETGPGFYFGVGGGLGAEPVRNSSPPGSPR